MCDPHRRMLPLANCALNARGRGGDGVPFTFSTYQGLTFYTSYIAWVCTSQVAGRKVSQSWVLLSGATFIFPRRQHVALSGTADFIFPLN